VERRVQVLRPGKLAEPEGGQRPRDDLGSVVRDPGRFEALAQRVLLSDPDPVAPVELRERNPALRILGMQVEREPVDVGVELAPCLLGRDRAEPAERSDVVAPDEDRMVGHGRWRVQRDGVAHDSRPALQFRREAGTDTSQFPS
jgi:hypothetical protein